MNLICTVIVIPTAQSFGASVRKFGSTSSLCQMFYIYFMDWTYKHDIDSPGICEFMVTVLALRIPEAFGARWGKAKPYNCAKILPHDCKFNMS